MKVFLTYYKMANDGALDIYNGFSFGCHHFPDAHYLFITDDVNLDKLKRDLEKYSEIYYSVTLPYQLVIVQKIVDKRWVIGGPYIDIRDNREVKLCDKLGVVDDDTFTPYWNKWVEGKRFSFLRYMANCEISCYWNKCIYCGGRYDKQGKRNLLRVLNQLPREYHFLSYVILISGSISPHNLSILADYTIPENIYIKVPFRPDVKIYNIIQNSRSLTRMDFNVGIENLSQRGLDALNKGFNIKNALLSGRMIVDRGGIITFNLISRFGIYDEKEVDENLDWIDRNLPRNNVRFWDSLEIEWPTVEAATKVGAYEITKCNPKNSHFNFTYNISSTNNDLRLSKKIINSLKNMGFSVKLRFEGDRNPGLGVKI